MATGTEVLEMLCPAGGWIISGNDFENIIWVDERPRCSKEQFEAGFQLVDEWKQAIEAKAIADKLSAQAKLEALGLTADDLKALNLG